MRHLFALALLAAASLAAAPASACSDAGPPNSCNDGGAAWISCSVNADCPAQQSCHPNGYCICGDCPYGETCDGAGCRCAEQTRPTAPSGCEAARDSCGVWRVVCPDDAGAVPMCPTDGGPRVPRDDESGGGDGCSAAPGGGAPLPAVGTALLVVAAALRRRR